MATMYGGIGEPDIPKSVRYLFGAGSLLIQLSLHDQDAVIAWMTHKGSWTTAVVWGSSSSCLPTVQTEGADNLSTLVVWFPVAAQVTVRIAAPSARVPGTHGGYAAPTSAAIAKANRVRTSPSALEDALAH